MRRVMHLRTVVGTGGGPEKTILTTPRYLQDYEVSLVYIRPRDDEEFNIGERAAQSGTSLIDIPESGGMDPRTLFRLRKEIAKFRPDIIHAHDYKTNFLALLCRPKSARLVTTVHGYVSRGGRLELYYKIDMFSLKRMDHIVTVSDDLQEQVTQMGIDSDTVTLVDNAIDMVEFSRKSAVEKAKRQLGFRSDRFLIGAVGRLAKEKGFDLLISAVERLIEGGLDVELTIIGEGDQREQLEAQIAASGHADRFHLLGYRSDTIALYEAMDLYVLSSLREGLPNVLLEAMAMEVPVVATKIAGVPKLIQDRENGLLVNSGSVDELEQAIKEILKNDSLREMLVGKARKTIETEFSFSVRMDKIRKIYDQVLAKSAST